MRRLWWVGRGALQGETAHEPRRPIASPAQTPHSGEGRDRAFWTEKLGLGLRRDDEVE
jgi:hypothetical protein